ncbi:hypothetical protein Bacsa_3453 [Phocaeicola salanitronis DSM 18170]|uniref:Uncharacterized protein n=1 Tax=Phocaeicola salanitronis (strain DSM 18170 / JCM 13657 / CCUG 60908 / BL78) TaxID=667015 RepID=F0R6S3_PHOSB|nr:hypothetical protein [Phocaeicola salanitronis]ADY37978.1 hypothetical protein Bacsa_3453 [Phocaeicola salanitronis DSM 18170]
MWKFVCKVIGTLFSILLWYLQEVPQESQSYFDKILRNYKYEVALIALVIVLSTIFVNDFIAYCKRQNAVQKWSNSFLKHIVKEHLGGRNFQTRISILRPRKGYEIIMPYLFVYPIKALFLEQHRICNKAYCKNIPYKLFCDYLTVYARYGYSDKMTSYTHFLITNRDENNGLAVKCYKEEKDSEVCTVSISNEKLPEHYVSANKRIKKYMSESYIDKKYYSTMLGMNTIANNLYAVPIFLEDQKIWGVMMIDNDSQEQISYKELLEQHIASYQKIFSYTLKILK